MITTIPDHVFLTHESKNQLTVKMFMYRFHVNDNLMYSPSKQPEKLIFEDQYVFTR